MKFLPSENINVLTKLSKEEAMFRLKDKLYWVDKLGLLQFGVTGGSKLFEGFVDADQFNIRRIIGYRNSSRPNIEGLMFQESNGLQIELKFRLPKYVKVGVIVLCSLAFLFSIPGLISLGTVFYLLYLFIKEGIFDFSIIVDLMGGIDWRLLQPFVIIFFIYPLCIIGFKYEVNKAKEVLLELFEAEILV